jgi:hypothetical protein
MYDDLTGRRKVNAQQKTEKKPASEDGGRDDSCMLWKSEVRSDC